MILHHSRVRGGAPRGSVGAGEREWCTTWKSLTIAFSQGYSFLLHPPAACLATLCMSLGLVMLMKTNQHTLVTGLSGKLPLSQLFLHLRICPFFSPSAASITFYSFRPQMLFFPKWLLLFQLRMMLLKPGLAMSMWKLGQKGFTSRFLHGIEQCPSVTLLCLSFFT